MPSCSTLGPLLVRSWVTIRSDPPWNAWSFHLIWPLQVINAVSIRHQRPFRAATGGDDTTIVFHQGENAVWYHCFVMLRIFRETGAPYKYVKVERVLYHLHCGLLTFLVYRLSKHIRSSCKTSSTLHQETISSQSAPMQRSSYTMVRKVRPWATFRIALTPVLL